MEGVVVGAVRRPTVCAPPVPSPLAFSAPGPHQFLHPRCFCHSSSLLALSIILALLLFKPAPMYILDEIDAALDLSHTQNIGRMLKTHFSHSQFIVVSLKEGMFNNANVIFRTKFVDGVSTVMRTVPSKSASSSAGIEVVPFKSSSAAPSASTAGVLTDVVNTNRVTSRKATAKPVVADDFSGDDAELSDEDGSDFDGSAGGAGGPKKRVAARPTKRLAA